MIAIPLPRRAAVHFRLKQHKRTAGDPAAVPAEIANLLVLGRALARTTLERKESRGGFYREDYPDPSPDIPEANILALSEAGEVTLRKEVLDPDWTPDCENILNKERWG